ncbi:hypothetical protein [Fodinicola feengrottensis]|uniref:hypothetical protein n=1 Tax=Fodinicola feengrottensis TaxID=435914 RepID=UPI0031D1321D
MTSRRVAVAVGRLVLRGLQDLGRCHAMADWAVFAEQIPVDQHEKALSEEKTDVRNHGLGGFRA